MKAEDFPWFLQQVLAGHIVAISSLEDLPPEAAHDREVCRQLGVKSNLTIPLSVGGQRPFGALGLNTTLAQRDWTDDLVKRLQLLAQVFANALARKRADQAVRQSEARLAAGTELAGLGYYEIDYAKRTSFIDDRFREICGVPPGRLQGLDPVQFWMEHIHPSDLQAVLGERQKLHDGRVDRISPEFRYLHPDLGEKWVHQLARRAERSAAGGEVRIYGVIRDITQQKQAEAELLRQRTELAHIARVSTMGELAASLAHELNQPLGAILANAETAEFLLEQDTLALEEMRAVVTAIRKDGERAGEVIRRMRGLFGKHELKLELLDLNSVVHDVRQLVSRDLALRGVSLSVALASGLPEISGDRTHLQQVVLNLIVNAMDALAGQPREKRHIRVSTCPTTDCQVEMAVTDSGPGIEPDTLPRVFQPFYTTKPDGMGMGLSIARTIIDAHCGRIWAENLTTLPSPRPTVLIVDDDLSFREAIERLVRTGGYAAQTFASAEEFLQCTPTDAPACVLLDLDMPGLSGLDLQRALAQVENPLPIVFLTGKGSISTSVQAMRAGAEDFLTKPARKQLLFAAIERALARGAQAREQRARRRELRARFDLLTPREREVLAHILSGQTNKQIAGDLGASERTIKMHRANLMAKLQVQSVAELARLAHEAGFSVSQ